MRKVLVVVFAGVFALAVCSTSVQADNFTFQPENGDWGVQASWLNEDDEEGVPDASDTAIVGANKTCTVDSAEAAKQLIVFGTVQVSDTLTLGEQLSAGETVNVPSGGTLRVLSGGVIEVVEDPGVFGTLAVDVNGTLDVDSGGQLNVSGSVQIDLHTDITVDGAVGFKLSGEHCGSLMLFADVTITGTGMLEGECVLPEVPQLIGPQISGAQYDLTLASGITLKNFRKTRVAAFINNGTVLVDFGGQCQDPPNCTNMELLGAEVYGSGIWHILSGQLNSDPPDSTITLYKTPGTPGTWIIDGPYAHWYFNGVIDPSWRDELQFIRGTFRPGSIDEFSNCGKFILGGHETDDMVIFLFDGQSFEVGLTCP